MIPPGDTIVAVATPTGRGGIGVVRISGASARAIAQAICGGQPTPRQARFAAFADADGSTLDRGLALYFEAPHSFTGEDVLELHAHGSPVVLGQLVRRACGLGARPARAGEFSERAFLNGKLDLAQAEAVADLIAARSEAQARAALRSLEGEFSRRVGALEQTIIRLRVDVEATIDFAEDAAESPARAALDGLFVDAAGEWATLLNAARSGVRLTDGLTAVIVGAPNVGKSSLMNALAGTERAIVTAIPGTTRDVLRESIVLDGIELALADTAGLREAADVVESEGIRRARAEMGRADVVLRLVDREWHGKPDGLFTEATASAARILVVNKIDLTGSMPRREEQDGIVTVALSAKTGAGLDLLRDALRDCVLGRDGAGAFSARGRHVVALERAGTYLATARRLNASSSPELVAEELREAHRALGELTGEFTGEDLLGAIFSTFCVGK